jgi:riboflavin kinase/FMN adenylyltransferase
VLTGPLRKAELIEQLGVDVLCVQPFTLDFSRLSAEQFVHDLLVEHLHTALVVVGENFRFGHKAAGDVELLTKLGARFGFGVEPAPLVTSDGVIFSSTYVRACVDAGDVETAALVLGRPHRVEGVVVRGDQRGREIGFPTANLLTARYTAIPADGVYSAWLVRGGQQLPAAVSIGTNPTFSGQERRVEAYVLDFDGDLYGERLALDFVKHLRPMLKFDGVPALVEAIEDDVKRTRVVLGVGDPR